MKEFDDGLLDRDFDNVRFKEKRLFAGKKNSEEY